MNTGPGVGQPLFDFFPIVINNDYLNYITKTNSPLPQKGIIPILIDLPDIYVAYAKQATISSVKHKPLFH